MLDENTNLAQFEGKPYLTEQSLYDSIVSMFCEPNRFLHDKQLMVRGKRMRPDVYDTEFKKVWEFDGPRHFTDPNVIVRDTDKEIACRGSEEVRERRVIPYFVQPTDTTVGGVLGLNHDCFWKPEFPHGFIGKKCVTPGFFCPPGAASFELILDDLHFLQARTGSNVSVATEILQSMWLRVKCYGEDPRVAFHNCAWYDPDRFPDDSYTSEMLGFDPIVGATI